MFDPSKLNLDLDKNEEIEAKKEEQKKEPTTVVDDKQKTENIESEKKDDILTELEEVKVEKEKTDLETQELKEELVEEKKLDITDDDILNDTKLVENIEEKNAEDEKKEKLEEKENKIIYDVNLDKLELVLYILADKEYDFVTFEPTSDFIKVEFRKNKVIMETKFIKYPIYSNILLKAKSLTKLKMDETDKEQEWVWETNIRTNNYKVISKTVPSGFGEKLFLKIKKQEKKIAKKQKAKVSFSQLSSFLWAIAFVWLIIWWGFIGFIAMNAKTVEDVKFFAGLWINLNDINNFISNIINIIFSILLLLETIVLIILLFKFIFTKKEFKQKKIKLWIISTLILIITFVTWSYWMVIDSKVKSLPNWQELAYWEVQVFDNSKLLSDSFDKSWAIIEDTTNLIWPVEIKFDLWVLANKEISKWYKINKFVWEFSDWDIIETPESFIIKKFDIKGNNEVKLTIHESDIQWEALEKVIEDIPSINISYVVKIEEKILSNWGKTVSFDASDLKQLWKIEWYNLENLEEPIIVSEKYYTDRPVFEETIFGMYIRRNDKESEVLDKVFIINWEDETELDWTIYETRSVLNDLEYSFKVIDIENTNGNWFVEKFEWFIWDKEYTKDWDIIDQEKSSEIKHVFTKYWENKVKVILTNSNWDTKTIEKTIDIPQKVNISNSLRFYYEDTYLEDIEYNWNLNEYFLNNIWVPWKVKIDARFVKPENTLYTLKDVNWDYNSDWDQDLSEKVLEYDIIKEWNNTITVEYVFQNRKIPTDTISLKEKIFIEAIKKEAIVDFKIVWDNYYIPTELWFDWSKSKINNWNIAQFIWDYGDGTKEVWDSIVPSHKYTQEWNYEITLTIVWENGKTYSDSKTIILKPKNQSANIKVSMKNAPTYQAIDFSSKWSEGQISSYFWKFWDWETSTDANPSHFYKKEWTYKVELTLEFSNKNVLRETVEIEIYEE